MLKRIAYLVVLIVLANSLVGCQECPEPKVVVKTKYISKPIPKLQKRPIFIKYNMNMANINGKDYYFMETIDGNIMLSNWESYRNWSENNYKILKGLEK